MADDTNISPLAPVQAAPATEQQGRQQMAAYSNQKSAVPAAGQQVIPGQQGQPGRPGQPGQPGRPGGGGQQLITGQGSQGSAAAQSSQVGQPGQGGQGAQNAQGGQGSAAAQAQAPSIPELAPVGPSFFGYKAPKWASDYEYVRNKQGKGSENDADTWLVTMIDRLLKKHSL